MRKILFRIKDHDDWYYGYPLNEISKNNIVSFQGKDKNGETYFNALADATTLTEFTGLLDKNGKMIFEGDIVATYDKHNKLVGIYFIEFYKYAYCAVQYLYGEKYYDVLKAEQRDESGEIFEIYSYEVVGNIYDNTELIKENLI